jgi:flagellar FliJ protein
MRYQFKFEKVMKIKEREKDESLAKYNESVKRFEEVAEKLYEFLKQKEDLQSYQSAKLKSGLSIQDIRHHQRFILNLETTIDHYQKLVQNARNQMLFYQEKLMEKNIEVKKYEIMKEKDRLVFLEELKQLEAKQMDDISLQQYMHRGS